jgi:hypothetical protein
MTIQCQHPKSEASANDYAVMRRAVRRDGRVAIAQMLNAAQVIMAMIGKLVCYVPLMAFWFAIGLALFAPDTFAGLVRELQTADPVTVSGTARTFLRVASIIAYFAIAATAVLGGSSLGLRNCYAESMHRRMAQGAASASAARGMASSCSAARDGSTA